MAPDFGKKTIETLAKRAAYICSNPDCRVNTIGPNLNPRQSTKIGEAAHIQGARLNSKRFNKTMTDSARAEITNAIWLCRNCHKLIDTDEAKYDVNLLFRWREQHEVYIAQTLGNSTEKIINDQLASFLSDFDKYPPIIRRIIIDKPDGWEYRLTAELMRHLNDPIFRRLKDLRKGLYIKKMEHLSEEETGKWIEERISELSKTLGPAVGLLDSLTKSWGEPGKPGDVKEILHVTKLMQGYLEHVVSIEERIHFVNVPKIYERLVSLLKNLIGSQVEKLSSIPSDLEEVINAEVNGNSITSSKSSKVYTKTFIFESPKNWDKDFKREINQIKKKRYHKENNSSGCITLFAFLVITIVLISMCSNSIT